MMSEFSTILSRQAHSIGIELDDRQIGLFEQFYEDLIEKNKVMNLTAITDMHEVINKHFIDSLMPHEIISRYIEEQSPDRNVAKNIMQDDTANADDSYGKKDAASECGGGVDDSSGSCIRICDIGTGAGFPGIPLAIVYPQVKFTLVDSLRKRIDYINDEAEKLGLDNVKGIHSRTEDLAHDDIYREQYDILVSRAVANLSTLTEYTLPFVKTGGIFIAYKSTDIDEELRDACKAIEMLGGRITSDIDMKLPETDIPRKILVIDKITATPKKYPRQAGVPSKKPLR